MSADFILKRGNVWHFNMRVLDDVRGHFGENQWRYSLRTKDRQEAIKLARQEAATKDQQIAQVRTAMGAPARKWQYTSIMDLSDLHHVGFMVGGSLYKMGNPVTNTASSIQQLQHITPDPDNMLSVVKNRAIQGKRLAVGSVKDYHVSVRRFIDIVGDKDVRTIDRSDVEKFKLALVRMPNTRLPKVLGMSVQEQIEWAETNNAKRIGISSVNKYLVALQSILTWARHKTAIFQDVQAWESPCKGFIDATQNIKQDSEEDDDRRPFTTEEVSRLFGSGDDFETGFVKGKTTRRWMVHIMRWTGLRLDEAAQIRTYDIQKTTKGLLYVAVTNRAEGQKVKTDAARRHVPLLPELIALGLLDFVQSIKEKHGEDTWLFHDLDHTNMKNRGQKVSSAFLRWVRVRMH